MALALAIRVQRFTMAAHMMDFAFFRLPDGRAWIGEGPFESLAQPDTKGACFYINDFDLTDHLPWKKPAQLHEVTSETIKTWTRDDAGSMRVQWEKPATEWFKMAFRRIRREVLAGRLAKMVPVLAESGNLIEGRPESLLHRVMNAPSNVWGYAHVSGARGFLGATPELLFRMSGNEVENHGPRWHGEAWRPKKIFLSDVKEIEEHELVVSFLDERLSTIGKVKRDPRAVLETSGLVHFKNSSPRRASVAPSPSAISLRFCIPRPPSAACRVRTNGSRSCANTARC